MVSAHFVALALVLCAGSDRLLEVRTSILGVYETKTSKALRKALSHSKGQAQTQLLALQHHSRDSGMTRKPIVILGDLNDHFVLESRPGKVMMTSIPASELAYAIKFIKEKLLLRAEEGHRVLPGRLAPPSQLLKYCMATLQHMQSQWPGWCHLHVALARRPG